MLARELITKSRILLFRVVILEGVPTSEVDIRIVDKFLLRALLKTSPI